VTRLAAAGRTYAGATGSGLGGRWLLPQALQNFAPAASGSAQATQAGAAIAEPHS
jgi:hypothetical protein